MTRFQINDPSLTNCRKQAEAGKGGFVIVNGAVYHHDKISDQSVCQLCVPVNRREEVLKLAHDSVFGGHLGERKTRERIRLSFFGPVWGVTLRDMYTRVKIASYGRGQ